MSNVQIAIYGGGGFAREVPYLIETCVESGQSYETVCFIDDNEDQHGKIINEIPVMGLSGAYQKFPDAHIIGAIGTPKARQTVMEKAEKLGFAFATIIHPRTEHSRWVEFGSGSVVCAGNIITTNITVCKHVHINLDCTLGHDVILGDFTTLAPGVHVSGWVHMGKRVYVGTGANIINGTPDKPIVIGDDAVIGAGACVTRSVAAGVTVVGVPAKPIKRS